MSPKVLLILLIVIALLAVMVIATGFRPDRTRHKYEQKTAFAGLDRFLGRFRDSFDVGRISGCSSTGQALTVPSGGCEVVIGPGKSKSSGFKLTPTAGAVKVCYGFERDKPLNDCVGNSDQWGTLKAGSRFDVGKDGAIIAFFCTPVGGSACMVRIILGE